MHNDEYARLVDEVDGEYDDLGPAARETEEQKERRLSREAANYCLGVLHDEGATDGARVEVTYQNEGGLEHCGYLIVHVASRGDYDPLDEYAAMTQHPATLANNRVQAWADGKRFAYFSIDDTSAV